MGELKKDSVERTLCIPLWSRAMAVKKLPQLLPDGDAVRILQEMGEKKPPTPAYYLQCAALAGAIRQYDFSREAAEYLSVHPQATVVELGAGLSCLRRQMNNEENPWINIDLPDVIACREKYIPPGRHERNLSCDLTDHRWLDQIPFAQEKGVLFLAAGVLHYLAYDQVQRLMAAMAERFPGGAFVFDFVSKKGARAGNRQIDNTHNAACITFSMEDARRELPAFSPRIADVEQKSYLEGYPVSGVRFSLLTRLYIRSKRNQYFVVRVMFSAEDAAVR